MYRDLLELARRIEGRVDGRRTPHVAIAAGVVYLIAFNTVLRRVNALYFGFVLLVAVLCMPFLLTSPAAASRAALVAAGGFLKRNPRVALFLVFLTYLLLATVGPDFLASPVVNSAITVAFCAWFVRIGSRERVASGDRPSELAACVSKWTLAALTAIARKVNEALED